MDGNTPTAAADGNRWIHPRCRVLETDRSGPFARAADGRVMTADTDGIRFGDDGRTWTGAIPARFGQHSREPASFYVLQPRDRTLVMVYLDLERMSFAWDDAAGEPKEGCRLELWAVRSTDGGATWTDRRRLLDGYNANFFGFIRTGGGRLVVCAEHLATDPGRWVVCSFVSDDDGATWSRSNFIDLGGRGHHDGATEPTVAELGDGRLLMLIRTNLDRFWQAVSEDGGRYWRTIGPSSLDASSSPGQLVRLGSGRLVLVWNRLNPEGGIAPRGTPGPASEVAASWHREELSIAFSGDDGESWSAPTVIARRKGGQLSYPHVFERRPGEIWVSAGFAFRDGWKDPLPLRLVLRERDLV